ncbi:TauD/TfdA family dioxygenase [Phenylobacterium parvum]|uniref:Taurine catabolism dioxygenase TauD n=1 Tax=Phenylobacterium parvum TaxID=2201350 RepID=A0A2Z3I1Q1_9CAUL|nr:TauD/TfdA family dioxygenase [Phenylobacterium parvum]AWM77718.1 taurine catabolism dioxygenase TauD [Phenylobacterium parvum]
MLTPSPLTTADAWLGRDMARREDWRRVLTGSEVQELVAARATARVRTVDRADWTKADFPLPSLAEEVRGWLEDLDQGRGFLLLRGLPVGELGHEAAADIYWGLGLHMGRAISQNTDGDLLGHVRDTGADPNAYGVRLYKTRAEQDFHTDGADIIGLLCLQGAKSGGVSRIASSAAIFNRLLEERPDLVPALFSTFPFDTQGQHRPGTPAWFVRPLCRLVEGRLNLFFIPWYIGESQRHEDAPRLSAEQQAVLSFIEATANDPDHYLDMDFQPGDIQLLKNASILHKRTAYEDWDDPVRKRHLLRLWLVQESFSAGDASLREGVQAPG